MKEYVINMISFSLVYFSSAMLMGAWMAMVHKNYKYWIGGNDEL